ncbi:MAG: YceD family protein [Limisphaerales bacterium]
MPLRVNLRQLEKKNLDLRGGLPSAELELEGVDELIKVPRPLWHDLHVQLLERSLLVTGHLRLVLECECGRCLRPFSMALDFPDWTIHLPLEGEDKVAVDNDCVDLTPLVREDILLAFPQHPLCDSDCAGLLVPSASSANQANAARQTTEGASAWAALNKLKL